MSQLQYKFNKNDEYNTPSSGEYKPSGVPFQSGYLCSGICKNQLEFEYINKEESNENCKKR